MGIGVFTATRSGSARERCRTNLRNDCSENRDLNNWTPLRQTDDSCTSWRSGWCDGNVYTVVETSNFSASFLVDTRLAYHEHFPKIWAGMIITAIGMCLECLFSLHHGVSVRIVSTLIDVALTWQILDRW